MVYSKTQPQSFLGSGEEDYFRSFTIYRHGGHLVHWCGTIRTNCQYPLDSGPHVKSGENSQAVSEKKIFKNYTIVYMYIAQEQGQITPRGQKFDCY